MQVPWTLLWACVCPCVCARMSLCVHACMCVCVLLYVCPGACACVCMGVTERVPMCDRAVAGLSGELVVLPASSVAVQRCHPVRLLGRQQLPQCFLLQVVSTLSEKKKKTHPGSTLASGVDNVVQWATDTRMGSQQDPPNPLRAGCGRLR